MALKTSRASSVPPSSQNVAVIDHVIVTTVLPFQKCHPAGIVQCISSADWLLLFSSMRLRLLPDFL